MQRIFLLLTLLVTQSVSAQIYLGGFFGSSGYNGDLNDKPFKRIKPAVGATLAFQLTNRFNLRTGLLLGSLEGGDQWSGTTFLKENRNLSFSTDLTELSLVGELNAFNLNKSNWTPYVFGGIALFHFNPYITDSGKKLYLKPLHTEGQGLPEYPDRKPYSVVQLSVPFGGGVKYAVNDNVLLGFELGFRKTMTDYLDDVSTSYVDQNVLLQQRNATAVRLSYRADDVPGGTSAYPDNDYPLMGTQRGGAQYKDWYYTAGFHLVFRLNNGFNRSSAQPKKSYGCETVAPL
jgi:opacity protein-like surface antigen